MAGPRLEAFVAHLSRPPFAVPDGPCWNVIGRIEAQVRAAIEALPPDFQLTGADVAVHRTAQIASSAELAGPVILGPGCRIGSWVRLRGGVWADRQVIIGSHTEVKASLVFAGAVAAHRLGAS